MKHIPTELTPTLLRQILIDTLPDAWLSAIVLYPEGIRRGLCAGLRHSPTWPSDIDPYDIVPDLAAFLRYGTLDPAANWPLDVYPFREVELGDSRDEWRAIFAAFVITLASDQDDNTFDLIASEVIASYFRQNSEDVSND